MPDRTPAFPNIGYEGGVPMGQEGLTKREFYAAHIAGQLTLSAFNHNGNADAPFWPVTLDEIAGKAFAMADAMVKVSDEPTAADQRIAELERKIAALEEMRPQWAQGYTSDSMAAQASTVALSGLWKMLGVDNQTAACEALRKLQAGATPLDHIGEPDHG